MFIIIRKRIRSKNFNANGADLVAEEKSCALPERVIRDGERPIGDLYPAYVTVPLLLKV